MIRIPMTLEGRGIDSSMNTLPTCPVCGHTVEPDGTHGEVQVTTEVQEDRPEEYILHRRCAKAVFGGWSR